jgi:2-amino-4-hydroxy-6-hydroxymethyldihydropteridine diphosphokinase
MTSPSNAETVIVYISIGSNINPEANLRQAVRLLRERCEVLALSSVYQSPAYGFADQPDFLDVVAKVRATRTPEQFKTQILDDIERRCGRDRASQINKDGPLPLDMDILLWGDSAFEFGSKPWRVPNKGITRYAAVAIPLAELAPEVTHPTEGITISEIAARFGNAEEVRQLGELIE